MRIAYAAALWQLHQAQGTEQDFSSEPLPNVDQRSRLHRILDIRRWRIKKVSSRTCCIFVLGFLWGIMMATWWGLTTCRTYWWQEYVDLAWAWKVSRWDARYAFAWCDTLSFSVMQTGAMWMAGWVTGPVGVAVAASMGTALLQANGVFPSTNMAAQPSAWPNAMQQQQLQMLQSYHRPLRQNQHVMLTSGATNRHQQPAITAAGHWSRPPANQNRRDDTRGLTEEQLATLQRMFGGGNRAPKRQKPRFRRGPQAAQPT